MTPRREREQSQGLESIGACATLQDAARDLRALIEDGKAVGPLRGAQVVDPNASPYGTGGDSDYDQGDNPQRFGFWVATRNTRIWMQVQVTLLDNDQAAAAAMLAEEADE